MITWNVDYWRPGHWIYDEYMRELASQQQRRRDRIAARYGCGRWV